MIKAERHDLIVAELAKRGAVGVQQLAELLGASSATIRRDIAELDANNTLLRTHGGAALRDRRQEPSYDAKVMAFLPEKRRIGALAASMLEPNLTVGCGGGTTVMHMIASIKKMALHIVTNAVNVALELRDAPHVDVLLTGGQLRKRTAEVVGHVSERTLRDVNLDLAIIGADGVDPELGYTTYDSDEAYVNRVLIGRARQVWILADHSKAGQVHPAIIHGITAANLLITDTSAPAKFVAEIEAKGVRVITA
jgi:DeoR/GlpR family transcriptional regulator of sugar metabolism